MSWMVNHDVYEQLGSPELKTLEDLHQFMLDAKDKGVKTSTIRASSRGSETRT